MPEQNILDRGKRSIVLDLKSPEDIKHLKSLIKTADGLIEGFRPGVMERLGLGPADLHSTHPSLVYGRMSGWGQSGPKAMQAGHDLNYIALSGALWYASPPQTPPFTPPTLVGDIGGGALYLVAGMLAGILRAKTTGQGTVVDAAIVDGSAHMMNLIMSMKQGGAFHDQRGMSLLDGPHWSQCYACADQKWISVQCLEPKFYMDFINSMNLADDKDFQHQYNPKKWPELTQRLADIFNQKTQAEWSDMFANSDACVAPVLSPTEAMADPHMADRNTWIYIDNTLQARPAPRFDGKVPETPKSSPSRGQHTEDILKSI
jgi:crotonobetainyl-CoA:carnitine CoA-transferase CaiB-like acyl-CoA transferase